MALKDAPEWMEHFQRNVAQNDITPSQLPDMVNITKLAIDCAENLRDIMEKRFDKEDFVGRLKAYHWPYVDKMMDTNLADAMNTPADTMATLLDNLLKYAAHIHHVHLAEEKWAQYQTISLEPALTFLTESRVPLLSYNLVHCMKFANVPIDLSIVDTVLDIEYNVPQRVMDADVTAYVLVNSFIEDFLTFCLNFFELYVSSHS